MHDGGSRIEPRLDLAIHDQPQDRPRGEAHDGNVDNLRVLLSTESSRTNTQIALGLIAMVMTGIIAVIAALLLTSGK